MMRYRVLLDDGFTVEIKELTYPELLMEVERRIYDGFIDGIFGLTITFLEEVEDEGQSSEDFKVGQH